MKHVIFILNLVLCTASFGSSRANSVTISNDSIDYQISDNQFEVVYIEVDNLSQSEARQKAMEKAADITVDNGFRYFKVNSEEKVHVASASSNRPYFPRNMYQELIVEDNFGRDPYLEVDSQRRTGIYPGIKLKITCYSKKPRGRSYDACNYTNCGS